MLAFCISLLTAGVAMAADPACLAHRPQDPSVPLCPANNSGILPEGYPVMAVSVSDMTGGPEFVADFVSKTLKAQPDMPPQFLMTVSPETMEKVRRQIGQMTKDPKQRERWLAALTPVDGPAINWQQDFYQNYVDPATGRPQPRELGVYRGHKNANGTNYYSAISKTLQKTCGVQSGAVLFPDGNKGDDLYAPDGFVGGNLEGGPGGLCFLGDDALNEAQWSAYQKKACAGGTPIRVPTSMLAVGHTDELVSTVRTGPGECDFAVLVGSPNDALESMAQDPSGRAMSILESRGGPILAEGGSLSDICHRHKLYQEGLRGPAPAGPRAIPERNGLLRLFMSPQAWAGAAGITEDDNSDDCPDLTNADFLRQYKTDPDLPRFNELLEEKTARYRKEVEAAWKRNNPNCTPRIVSIPALYQGLLTEGGKNGESGRTVYPNVMNLQQFGKTLLIPDPQTETMRREIRKRVEALGLKADFINTNAAHQTQGNLHCSTNAIRYCRPRSTVK